MLIFIIKKQDQLKNEVSGAHEKPWQVKLFAVEGWHPILGPQNQSKGGLSDFVKTSLTSHMCFGMCVTVHAHTYTHIYTRIVYIHDDDDDNVDKCFKNLKVSFKRRLLFGSLSTLLSNNIPSCVFSKVYSGKSH